MVERIDTESVLLSSSNLNFIFYDYPLTQVQLKAEAYAKEVVHGTQPSSSTVPTTKDPWTATPMNITIDLASTQSDTEEGDAGDDVAKTGQV